jgi:predicted DNA repair protein MutK
MVGGGILLHGWPALAHAVEAWAAGWGSLLAALINTAAGAAVGVVAGAIVLGVVTAVQRLRRR